ncbi:MAG: IS110 family transposase [Acidimicrobiales bacterium]
MVIVDEFSAGITGGVDTHLEVHVAAALDPVGGLLGVESFEAGRAGEDKLITWLCSFGSVVRVGVEGTGSYGAGLARRLRAAEIDVVEVDRPNRQVRHRRGKTDPLDAVEAARAAQGGRAVGQAKSRDGNVEAIRVLLVARRSARSARIKALNQIRHLSFTAPDELRERFQGVSAIMLGRTAAGLRPWAGSDPVLYATKTSIRTLGRRVVALEEEIDSITELLGPLVTETAPDLLALHGVGVDTAAVLLVAAGDNPERLRSEPAWAHLCGVAPIEASSGKVTRHRLNRGGDRNANQALWRIALTRMSNDPRTRAYVERRSAEGKSKREIMRILKRYIAREVYHHLRPTTP